MRQDLNRLLWDVRVEASTVDALFGGKATITVTVTDRNADPVQGATVSFTTDWGSLTSSIAVTNAERQGVRRARRRADRDPRQARGRRHPPAREPEGRRRDARQPRRGRVREGAVRAGGARADLEVQPAEPAPRPRHRPAPGADHRAARPAHRDGHGAREGESGSDRARRRQRPGPVRRLDPRLGADEDRRRDEAGHRRRPDRGRDAAGHRGGRVRPDAGSPTGCRTRCSRSTTRRRRSSRSTCSSTRSWTTPTSSAAACSAR